MHREKERNRENSY